MSNVLQFPSLDDRKPRQTVDAAELVQEIERQERPAEELLHELLSGLNQIECASLLEKSYPDLDYQARDCLSEGEEPPFWAEQYREARAEIMGAEDLIRRARTRLAFTLWHAFPKQKPINADWMDAHVGKAHKAVLFRTFDNRDGNFFVSAATDYDGRLLEYSDEDMALIDLVLRSSGFERYPCEGENGPQWSIPFAKKADDLEKQIEAELEKFDFLAITWEDVTR